MFLVHRLSCSTACGIFLDQGSNLCLLHWQMDLLPLSHQGSPVLFSLLTIKWCYVLWRRRKLNYKIFLVDLSTVATCIWDRTSWNNLSTRRGDISGDWPAGMMNSRSFVLYYVLSECHSKVCTRRTQTVLSATGHVYWEKWGWWNLCW